MPRARTKDGFGRGEQGQRVGDLRNAVEPAKNPVGDLACLDEGVAGVIVSNHGGRQLDGVSPTLRALPEVLAAVKGRAEVLMDGGIRRGADIVKALCLGARAVLIGRAYAYGLGAAGGPGVARAIEILRDDLTRTMKLLGCAAVKDLDHSYIDAPAWSRDRQHNLPHVLA